MALIVGLGCSPEILPRPRVRITDRSTASLPLPTTDDGCARPSLALLVDWKSTKPSFSGDQKLTLIRDTILKQPNQQHRQFVGMGIMFRYDLGKYALQHGQIGRPKYNVCR